QLGSRSAEDDQRQQRKSRLGGELQRQSPGDWGDRHGINERETVAHVGERLDVACSQQRLRRSLGVVHPFSIELLGVGISQPAVFKQSFFSDLRQLRRQKGKRQKRNNDRQHDESHH